MYNYVVVTITVENLEIIYYRNIYALLFMYTNVYLDSELYLWTIGALFALSVLLISIFPVAYRKLCGESTHACKSLTMHTMLLLKIRPF